MNKKIIETIKITTIQIDQEVTSRDKLITRIVDEGGIEAIRANSHRYVGVFDSTANLMSLRQLDDNDGTKYLDGTTAPITTAGNDVWMKLPKFWYKCEEVFENNYNISFAYGGKPDDTWKEWDGKDLIGVYKSGIYGGLMCSLSGRTAAIFRAKDANSYSEGRGSNFSQMKWKHHCMLVFLYFAYYNSTDSFDRFGGTSNYGGTTGASNRLGMNDSGSSDSFNNFWGIENCWTQMNEFITNTSYSKSTGILTIVEDDKTKKISLPYTSYYRVNKLVITEDFDYYPKEYRTDGLTPLYPDNFGAINNESSNQILRRSYYKKVDGIGVANIGFWVYGWRADNSCGARLTYRGDYIIID